VRYQSVHFVLYAAKLPANGESRLGITVSRRVGTAVVRNRVKRRVRECYRLTLRPTLPQRTALVVIARNGAGNLAMADVRDQLTAAAAYLADRLAAQ